MLQTHPAAIVVCDEAACDELSVGTFKYFLDKERDNF
jgi:glucosamine-6-phosphate deaminase